MLTNTVVLYTFLFCCHMAIYAVLGQYRPLPGNDGNSNTQELMIFESKRCNTTTECRQGFECRPFQRVLEQGAAPTEVYNCAQCAAACADDTNCPQNEAQIASDPGSRQKCFRGCCNRMDKEKEIMKMPILRGGLPSRDNIRFKPKPNNNK